MVPEQEWKLVKTSNGILINILRDNRTNTIPFFSTAEFGRGDQVEFVLSCPATPGRRVAKGDTIGRIYSYQEQFKLLELRRELIEQQRLRDINIAGEKPQRTRAALEELRLAESDLETEERSFERSKQLYEAEVISDEEFEVAENSYRQKKQQVRIAQANYEDVTAGSKKEEIDLVEATIEAVRKEIAKTRERIDALTIETPVSGVFSNSYNPDETGEEVLARVASNRNMVLKAPVEITQKPFLSEGMTVEINGTHPEKEVQGKVLFVHNEVKSLDGRQIVFATCLLPNEDDLLFPNLRIEGVIIGDKINLCEYLYRMLGTIFTS